MKKVVLIAGILALVTQLYAEKLTVFVAANARHAMSEIKDEFMKNRPNDEIELTFGATGKAYQQLKNGFPYDMFFAANTKHAVQIETDGNAATKPKVYALGAVALYALDEKYISGGLDGLKKLSIKNFSIANPKVAPYGEAAVEILKNSGNYDKFEKIIVLGDNISQAVSFVDSGAVEVGLVALSLLRQGDGTKGKYIIVDSSLHAPIAQSFVIVKRAEKSALAKDFAAYVGSQKAKEVFIKYGYEVPKD